MNEKPKAEPQPWTLSDTAISTYMGRYNYSIELVRLQTKREILMAIFHLSTKTWMSKEGLKQFAKILLEITPHSWRDIDNFEVQPSAPYDKKR